MVRRRVVYSGRVQSVGFRATVREIATRHGGVSGWVRNDADGGVTAEFQGSVAAVAGVIESVRERMVGFIRGERGEDLPVREGERGFVIER